MARDAIVPLPLRPTVRESRGLSVLVTLPFSLALGMAGGFSNSAGSAAVARGSDIVACSSFSGLQRTKLLAGPYKESKRLIVVALYSYCSVL